LLSTAIGLPVSTSHCLVGALIGVGIAGKCNTTEEGDAEAQTPRNAPLDFTVLKKIVLAWYVHPLL
jgi:phosphate/sulfate permease